MRVVLQRMAASNRVPPALLFEGPRGTGKTTTARILASSVNCLSDDYRPCGECISCIAVFGGSSLDVLEIDAASNGLVSDIRSLRDTVTYSVGGKCRVVILDEFHSASKEAANALLKTLEDPPARTVFILVTTEPKRIIDTVASRCVTFPFRRVRSSQIVDRLKYICEKESLDVSSEVLEIMATRSNGGVRDAIMSLEMLAHSDGSSSEEYLDLFSGRDLSPGLIDAAVRADHLKVYKILDESVSVYGDPWAVMDSISDTLRDVLILSFGGELDMSEDWLESRRLIAKTVPQDKLVSALRILWDLRTKFKVCDELKALQLASILLVETLKAPSKSSNTASKKLSLSDLRV